MKTFIKICLSISLIAIVCGVAISVIALASGASFRRDIPTVDVSERYTGVQNLDFQIAYGEVNIIDGDTFSIDARNIAEHELETYVSDGTWFIRDNTDGDFSIFGNRISIGDMIHWNGDYAPKITITLPKDFNADKFDFKVGAGEVKIDSIQAATGSLEVDAGQLTVERISVSGESTYNVGTGHMVLGDAEINDISLDCGVGGIEIEGNITGDNNISCGVGSVRLDLKGSEGDYSYDIHSGIGSVQIDGDNYSNIDKKIDHESGNNLTLDCGIGNITVDFN